MLRLPNRTVLPNLTSIIVTSPHPAGNTGPNSRDMKCGVISGRNVDKTWSGSVQRNSPMPRTRISEAFLVACADRKIINNQSPVKCGVD